MSRKWEDWITLVAGMWLLVAPNALGFSNVARTDAMWVGALILLVGLWALLIPGSRAAEWSALLLGLGLFLAPWVLNFSGQGTTRLERLGDRRTRSRCCPDHRLPNREAETAKAHRG